MTGLGMCPLYGVQRVMPEGAKGFHVQLCYGLQVILLHWSNVYILTDRKGSKIFPAQFEQNNILFQFKAAEEQQVLKPVLDNDRSDLRIGQFDCRAAYHVPERPPGFQRGKMR